MSDVRLVTIKDAMRMFGVKYDLLHDAILEDALPAIRPGRSWLVKPDDVEEFLYRRHAEREAAAP